jgi:hypothetical protein
MNSQAYKFPTVINVILGSHAHGCKPKGPEGQGDTQEVSSLIIEGPIQRPGYTKRFSMSEVGYRHCTCKEHGSCHQGTLNMSNYVKIKIGEKL